MLPFKYIDVHSHKGFSPEQRWIARVIQEYPLVLKVKMFNIEVL